MPKRKATSEAHKKTKTSLTAAGVQCLTTLVGLNAWFANEGSCSSETAEVAPSEELLQNTKDSLPDFDARQKCEHELDVLAQSVRNQNSSRAALQKELRESEIKAAKFEEQNVTLKKRPKLSEVQGVLYETVIACSTGEESRIASTKDTAKRFLDDEDHEQFCTELNKLPGIHANAQKGSKVVGKRADKAKSTIEYVAEKALGSWFFKTLVTIPLSSMSVQTIVYIEDVVDASTVHEFSYIQGLLYLMSQIVAASIDKVTKMINDNKATYDAKPQSIGPDSQQAWVTAESAWVLKLLYAASLTLDAQSSNDEPIKLSDVNERTWMVSHETKRVPRSKLLEQLAMNAEAEPVLFMKDKDLRLFAMDNKFTSMKTAPEILKVANAFLANTKNVMTDPDYMKGLREKADKKNQDKKNQDKKNQDKKNQDKKKQKVAEGGAKRVAAEGVAAEGVAAEGVAAEGGAAEGGAAEGGKKTKKKRTTVIFSDDESDDNDE